MISQRDDPRRLFLIEDDDEDARRIREAFDELPIDTTVRVASDGAEALARLTDHADEQTAMPDLVLLDLNLPEMDGLEVLDALAAEPKLARVPVLVLTQSTSREDVSACYERAANAFLTKPTDAAEYAEMATAIAEFWFRRATLPTNAA